MSYLTKYLEAQNREFQTADDKKYIKDFEAIQAMRSHLYTIYFTWMGKPYQTKTGKPYVNVEYKGDYYTVYLKEGSAGSKVSTNVDINIYFKDKSFDYKFKNDLREYLVYLLNDTLSNVDVYVKAEQERFEKHKINSGTTSSLLCQTIESLA